MVVLTNYMIQWIGEAHYAKNPDRLFDIIQESTPNLHEYEFIVNLIPLLVIGSLFIFPITTDIMEEFFVKFTLILVLRAMTTLSTILPKHEKCETKDDWSTRLVGGCYDKIFSGHTAFTALWTLIFVREKFISHPMFWGINIFNMLMIVVTRSHYTVDVILGFILTYLVYDGNYSIFTNFFKNIGK
jgi:hypothetical protein